jgi:uncharacterized protein involved in outer membrane biogenesis
MHVSKKVWITGLIVATMVAAVAFFEWNWLRLPLAWYMSERLGRVFAIDGDLHVEWSRRPLLLLESVSIANVPRSAEPVMARVQRVGIRIDPLSLLRGSLVLSELSLVQPRVLLERGPDLRGNWDFAAAQDTPQIEQLLIDDGRFRYTNATEATDVTFSVASSPRPGSDELPVHFSGEGRLHDRPVTIEGDAGSLVALGHVERPYRLDVELRSGDTRAHFDGTLVPNRPDELEGSLAMQGGDLSELYPLLPVPFPWTPAYRLKGQLEHTGRVWTFHEFTGKVGESDLAGRFALDLSRPKPFVNADLASTRLNYKDLGGLIGLPPAHEPPEKRTPAQNREVAKRERSDRVLPTRPYDLAGFRSVDAKIRFKGKRFIASDLPLDNLNAVGELRDGVLALKPLDFGIAGGLVSSTLTLDARETQIRTTVEATVHGIELKDILPALKPPNGSAGKVSGHARFSATGNSIADMLASSNGEVAALSWGGEASELAVVLTNLDVASAAPLLLRGDANSPIRCVVADFVAKDGTLFARNLVMDTQAEKILGEGYVDFSGERYDLALNAHSKRLSVLALRGPILIDGSFKAPHVHPATGPVAARVGASVALGAALTPIAALLPLIDVGGTADADCRALMEDAEQKMRGARQATEAR